MKTKLLPIVAVLSAMAFTAQADNTNTNAYVTDSYGNIVVDSWGSCTRSINWTPETAIASCEKKKSATTPDNTKAIVADKPKKTCATKVNNDIKDNGLRGYAIDSDGDVVRDSWGACVRTIEWTEATEIAHCEGKEEPVVVVEEVVIVAPEPVVVAPVIVAPVTPIAKPKPAPQPTIAHLREFFDTNSAKLKPSAHAELDAYAEFLTAYPNQKVTITGHTDSRGEASYNQQLSEKRAKAVKAYLVNKGIDASRMETHGAGETQPIADNKTREGRAQNRRVEIELIK